MTRQVTWESNTGQALERIQRGAAQGIEDAAKDLLADSLRLVPRDTGGLAESGRVATERDGQVFRAAVGYGAGGGGSGGGSVAAQAVIQHEVPYTHERGQNKYLEQPFVSGVDRLGDVIAAALQKALS